MWSYNGAYESRGRVYAPLRPFVTAFADRIWFEGDSLVIVRDGRTVRVRLAPLSPDALDCAYVPLATVLRSLGETVRYERGSVIVSRRATAVVETPTPFDPGAPSASPRTVFTPSPVATPRPVWTGSPLPRRTPLPYPTMRP